MIRCDYCRDALPSVQDRSSAGPTPDMQRQGFAAESVVCPECAARQRTFPRLQRRRELARLSKIELIDRVIELESSPERYAMDAASAQRADSLEIGLDQ